MNPHSFALQEDGLWWCETENVISEECSDDTRCDTGCVCNMVSCDDCQGLGTQNGWNTTCETCGGQGQVPRDSEVAQVAI